MAKVSVQHLSGFVGIGDFSVEIEDREFVVFAGPAGCGAGKILRAIAGVMAGAKGEVFIGEKRVDSLPAKDRDVAMVFCDDALYPRMTVRENLAFGLVLRKFPKREIERRIAETAALLGIEQWLGRRPGGLTEAERRRVALGRAIARQPKVFLFDEPLEGLDVNERAEMRAEILRLHQRLQATMLYATRDPVEAMTMGGRVVLLNSGAIQQIGPPLEVYREPVNLFVAGYLGRPAMNLIRGKLREAGEALIFKESGEGVIEAKLSDRPEAKAFAGREIVAGIRPEDIRIVTEPAETAKVARPGTTRFRALLDVAELLGAESIAHLETGAHRLIALTERALAHDEAGHRVQFEIDPARVHLFDPETTRRIASQTPAAVPATP